jgi:hypothetical protein
MIRDALDSSFSSIPPVDLLPDIGNPGTLHDGNNEKLHYYGQRLVNDRIHSIPSCPEC